MISLTVGNLLLTFIWNILIFTTNSQTTVSFGNADKEFELITEDLLRIHSVSNVTFHTLWNRIGFNGYDQDGNRRRDIIDEWDDFPPLTVHVLYCDTQDCNETNFKLKITIDVEKQAIAGNISNWKNVQCTISMEGSTKFDVCSFEDTVQVVAGNYVIRKDSGIYTIKSGTTIQSKYMVLSAIYNDTVCLCDCVYFEKMEAAKNTTREKKSMEELKNEMGPELKEMQKNLTVDTSTLSAFINRKKSKDDKRKSSQQIGIVGIIFLALEVSALLFADLLSVRQHLNFCREQWNGILRRLGIRNIQL